MYNRQSQLWPTSQYQNANVSQVLQHHSAPAQPSYQGNVNINTYQDSNNQLAGWDTVNFSEGHASQVQRQPVQHASASIQGHDPQYSREPPVHQEQSGSQYQGQSYYDTENYRQEGWLNYNNNNNNASQQYADYNYGQNNATYSSGNYENMNQSSTSSLYEQNQGNYSQSNAYDTSASSYENGMNVQYESPLNALEERRTDTGAYNLPTSFFSKKLEQGSTRQDNTWQSNTRQDNIWQSNARQDNTWQGNTYKKKKESQDFRRPPPVISDPDIPADIAARFETNHCKMCDVKLNSRVQSQMHYEGKPHAKKLKATLDKRFGITPGYEDQVNPLPISIPTLTSIPTTLTAVPTTSISEKTLMMGFVAASSGNLHGFNEDLTSSEGNKSGVIVSRIPGQKTGLGFVGVGKKKNKKKKKQTADRPEDDTLDSASSPKKKKKVITDFSQLYCKCCDISFTSQEHATEHFLGRNHQRVLHGLTPLKSGYFNKDTAKWQRSPSDPVTPTELLKRTPDGKLDHDSVKGKGKFFCDLCGIAATSSDQLKCHMTGVRHQQMVKQGKEGGTSNAAGENKNPNSAGVDNDDSALPMSFFSKKLGFSDDGSKNDTQGEASTIEGAEENVEFDSVGLPTSFFSKKLSFNNKPATATTNKVTKNEAPKPKGRKSGGRGGGGGRGVGGGGGRGGGGGGGTKRKRSDTILASVIKGQDNRKAKNPFKPKDFSIYRTPSGKFYCAPCDITLNSEVQFAQHFESKKHHMKKK